MRLKNAGFWMLYGIFITAVLTGSIGFQKEETLAVSAAMNLALSDENIMTDDTFSVVLTIESSEDIGNVDTFLTFDTKKLQFIKGGVSVTGGDGVVYISDKDSEDTGTKKKYSMKFKAIQDGETTIAIDDDPKITCALDGLYMSVSRNQLLFHITDPHSISDDAELAGLTVFPGILSPEFKNSVYQYTMEVEADVDKITVDARPYDENAAVSVTGNTNLTEGKNKIKIVVTAPAGNQETITITVTRKKAVQDKEPEKEEDQEKKKEPAEKKEPLSLQVKAREDKKGNIVLSQALELTIFPVPDPAMIPENYEETIVVIDGYPITVYTWKYDLNSDLLLVYGENQNGEGGLYQYSRETKTLNEYMGEAPKASESKEAVQNTMESENYKRRLLQMGAGLVILLVICIILSILLALNTVKNRKQGAAGKKDEYDDFF